MKDYKRLTERDEFGNADIIGIDSHKLASGLHFDELNKLTSALNRFAALEDKIESGKIDYVAGSKPDQTIIDLITEFDEMGFAPTTLHPDPEQYAIDWRDRVRKEFVRLITENAELKKRLDKELPCKVGDTIYCIHRMSNPIIKNWKVQEIIITDHNFVVICGHPKTKDRKVEVSDHYKEWWFTDRATAKARLAEIKGGKE